MGVRFHAWACRPSAQGRRRPTMNARVYLVLLTCVCIDQHVSAAPTPVGTAVMHRSMRLRDSGATLPYPKGGDVYVCPAVLENGYLVVCRDKADVPRIAFLPNQDEWGHATARAWQSDTSLETNTIVIRRPLAFQPGFFKRHIKSNPVPVTFGIGPCAIDIPQNAFQFRHSSNSMKYF